MSKLDFDLLQRAPSYINAIKDRELNLRGQKIQRVENLILTKDQNDTIDFTDNDLRLLDNFPPMPRLKTVLASNNRICKIDPDLFKYTPNLQVLMLNNNQLTELGDLVPLEQLTKLKILSLLDNPVVHRKYYRPFLIHKCPSIRVLDFKRERTLAENAFKGAEGLELLANLSSKTSIVDLNAKFQAPKKQPTPAQGPTPADIARIRNAIKLAKSLEEIAALEKQLQNGGMPL